jgi:hypothetical protein
MNTPVLWPDTAGAGSSPGPRHRRVTRFGRYAGRAANAAAVVATVLAGGFIKSHVPDVDRREQPFVQTGGMGQPVDGRTFSATVLDTRGGSEVDFRGQVRDTSGVWVVTRVRLVARAAPMSVGYAALVDDRGRRYLATERFVQAVPGGLTLQPDIPVVVEIAFEVPADVATPLHLRLADRSLDLRMDAMAQCRLPVDGPTVQRWRSQPEPLRVGNPQVGS